MEGVQANLSGYQNSTMWTTFRSKLGALVIGKGCKIYYFYKHLISIHEMQVVKLVQEQ